MRPARLRIVGGLFVSRRERWVAPAEDGGVLIDPPLERVEELLETNRKRLNAAQLQIGRRFLPEIRGELQDRLAVVADGSKWASTPNRPKWPVGPVIAAGHQPDLYHPGVWAKNFALNGFARRFGLAPLNLVVDSDTVKSAAMPFPIWNSDPERVTRELVSFDDWHGEEVDLYRPVHNASRFRDFVRVAEHVWGQWPFAPLLPAFWQEAIRVHDEVLRSSLEESGEESSPTLMSCLTSARRELEWNWGCSNRELFLLTLDRRQFIGHVLADLPRFHSSYNQSVRSYRTRYKLRSHTHPVPDLATDGDFLEAPFWWYEAFTGQRRRLFARSRGDQLELRAGRDGALVAVPVSELHASVELAQRGVHLFTRALTTTMFIRLFIADLFIHGIGGAKYDEVTDDIIRHYFGIEPPEYMVVSGSLHLPFRRFPATAADRQRHLRALRDQMWNPQRYVSLGDPKIKLLVDQRQEWSQREPQSSAERRERFRVLLRTTEALRPLVASRMQLISKNLSRCQQELAANDILFRRDYPFVLYPEEKLKPFCTRLLSL
jgi:hypothetical protein